MVLTDRVITVNGDTSTLDSKVYLYRGDKNVQVNLSIVNSKFRFTKKTVDNIIESTEAFYVIVRLIAPNGTQITFPAQPIENGKAVWVIEEELINDIDELGYYNIQIRLLNAEKDSIITIPPVLGQIEVLEPIFVEGDTAILGEGEVSNTRLSPYSGVQRDTLLSDGNYNRKTWVDKEVIYKEDLNTLEDISYKNRSSILNQSADLTKYKQEVDEQFNTKANKDEIWGMSNMGQDVREKFTGGSVAVIGTESVNDATLVLQLRKSLTEDSYISYIEHDGYFANAGGTNIAFTSNGNYKYYEITLNEYDMLHCASAVDRTSAYQICFVDSAGLILEKYNNASSITFFDNQFFVAPKTTVKCYFNIHKGNSSNVTKSYIKKRTIKNIEEALNKQEGNVNNNLNNINFINNTLQELSENRCLTKVNMSWSLGYWKDTGIIESNTITAHSENYIQLKAGDEITCNSDEVYFDILDENKQLLQNNFTKETIFKTYDDIKIYLNFKYKDLRTVSDLTVINNILNFKLYLSSNNNTETSYWKGKTIVWYGTSIPAGYNKTVNGHVNSYPLMIGDLLGANVINKSVGGSMVASGTLNSFCNTLVEKQLMEGWSSASETDREKYKSSCYDQCLDPYLTDETVPDLFVFDYGYNDWSVTNDSNLPVDLYDKSTLIGGLNWIFNRIKSKYPHARIVMIGHYTTNQSTNSVGSKAKIITECQEKVANLWEIPLFKTWEHIGWSSMKIKTTGYWDNVSTSPTYRKWIPNGGVEQEISILGTYMADGLHPHTDYSGKALDLYKEVLYPFIRDVR